MYPNQTMCIEPDDESGPSAQDAFTVSRMSAPSYTVGSIDLSSIGSSTVLSSPYTVTSGLTANAFSGGFNAGVGWTGANATPWTQAPRINLDGEGADIVVNGWSLVDAVKRIEQRLGLFQPNPALEADWDQLRDLGEQYRKLEQHIQDKQATWDRLRAMPAPEID